MPTSAQNLAALRREIARVGGRRNPSSPLAGLTYLDSGEDIGDLVNGAVIEGWAAMDLGQVKAPPHVGMGEFTHVVLVATAASRFDIILFDDEAVYQKVLYKNIPDRKTAEMLAKATYNHMNRYTGYFGRDYIEAAEKYGV